MRPNYRHPPKPIDRPDHVSVLIPTRGRPDGLKASFTSFQETVEHKNLFDTWIYVDDDDRATLDYINGGDWKRYGFPINWHVAKNTGSMGAMFNELWQGCTTNPGLYFPFVDDYIITTRHWDTLLHEAFVRCEDGLMLGFLPDPTTAPHQVTLAVPSSKWLNLLGYFITSRFYFWFDDQWLDEIAQMIGRKVMIPIHVVTPGGKGKTPRMRRLPFWSQYLAHTLEDRYDDAIRILTGAGTADPVALHAAIDHAQRAAAVLVNRFNTLPAGTYEIMETSFRDTTHIPTEAKLSGYLTTELNAVDDLMSKLKLRCETHAHHDVVDLADTLALASFHSPDTDYLKARALFALGFPADARVTAQHALDTGSTEPGVAALLAELETAVTDPTPAYYASRSELRMPAWLNLPDLGFVLFPAHIPQELYFAIQNVIYRHPIDTVVDIGAGDGAPGSSIHAVASVLDHRSDRRVFCIEPDSGKCAKLASRYAGAAQIYHGSSVAREAYLSEDELIGYYRDTPTIINYYPIEAIVQWRRDELARHDAGNIAWDCIDDIKRSHAIEAFDLAILDGSLFTGSADLDAVYGARFLFITHVRSIKNRANMLRLLSDSAYRVREAEIHAGCGYALFERVGQGGSATNASSGGTPASDPRTSIMRAFDCINAGDLTTTTAICNQLLADGNGNFFVHYLLGIVASVNQDKEAAIARLTTALTLAEGIPAARIADVHARLQELGAGRP